MEIRKICKENPDTEVFESCKCNECLKNNADVIITVGKFEIPLCKECAWDLEDILDNTTSADFLYAATERGGVEHEKCEHS